MILRYWVKGIMNTALISRCFQIVFFIGCGCSILIADCLEINAFNTLEDGISFSSGSKAILQCVINPYTGGQTWKVDSVLVAECGFVSCAENSSNSDRYSFTPNVTTGSFIFTIDPILYGDDGNVIECLDGSSTINHTVVIAGLSNSTCDHCDYNICIYLATLGEMLHFIVSIQHIYQSFALYSFQKRIGSIRLIVLNFLAWFPVIGCLIFKGILENCHEGQCRDCQKQYRAEGYCYNCKANLCIQCFKRHQPLHKTLKIGNTCDQCNIKCMPEYCCLQCEWYLCKLCLRKPGTLNNHQCKQRKKMRNIKQGKRKCHDCNKEADAGHICLICMDHLCTHCFNNHYHSPKGKGATKCTHCNRSQEQPNIKGYCLTCSDILCEHCLETNNSFGKHETRQIYREVNNIKTKYKILLALACFPGLSWAGLVSLWIICWRNIRNQTITFILLAVVGCIFVIVHPFVVLKACLAACECEILQGWYKALLAIKYIFLGWIPSAIVLVFIKLLEDSFYCDDCKNNSQVHGYCIECNQYLCGRCVRKHENMFHYILKHSQKIGKDKYFNTCGHKVRNEMFYCTNSKQFICKECNDKRTNEHRKYTIRQHDKKRNTSVSVENHQPDDICHDMLSDKGMSYSYFCKLSEIRRHIKDAFNQCQYNKDGVECKSTSAYAYCLTCKLCLCQECLKKHHSNQNGRQCYEDEHGGICLFCDNCLRKDGTEMKAEYYNVKFNFVQCAQCILERSDLKRNADGSQNTGRPKTVKEKYPCEVHKAMVNLRYGVEFTLPENTTTDRVRCNVCEMVMCGTCFVDHFNITKFLHHYQYNTIVRTKEKVSDTGQYKRDVYFACDGNNCREARAKILCLRCKKHLCEKCIKIEKEHDQNHAIVEKKYCHDPLFRRKTIFCQNDHKGKEHPAECLDFSSQDAMCASCFEDFNTTTNNTPGDQSKQCQLCPDNKKRPVNVYCLVCRGYMCVTCFKWHKRLKQSWQEPDFYDMLEKKTIKEAESSPKRSVPSYVVFRIITGPILLFELINVIRSCCCNDATVTPSGQEKMEKQKAEREQQNQGRSTTDIDVAVTIVSKTKHRDGETKL